ncbi:hypothetical protein G5B37_11060 [Rasiella rasia]|uniref:Uncharacterized protein n=1 Tax=Rasiella rasia TaxID=2744027 RepID=A0A6G6GNT7_9FLAO|nr:hypothetical protein [Rasiella rasia]QIE60083.1 hypothetical protein G5B37_11060 [Rasiella rasia]
MNQPIPIITFLRNTTIIVVAALYCLAPLQKPLADGFHKLEHTLLNTNSHHSHDFAHTLDVSHTHDHKVLAFFNTLFQDDAQGNEKPVKEFKLDKHIVQQFSSEAVNILVRSEKNFNYTFEPYSVVLPYILPPPRSNFS